MDEDLLSAALLVGLGILLLLARAGIVSSLLLWDIWPAILLVAGLIFLYMHFRRS